MAEKIQRPHRKCDQVRLGEIKLKFCYSKYVDKQTSKEYVNNLRHSCAHLLAAAVLELFPGSKNAIGPAIEEGFYQDFDLGATTISDADFPKIENKMRQILKTWDDFQIKQVSVEQAKRDFAWNPYKLELIDELATQGKTITETKQGSFLDLCKGGHTENLSKDIGAFKLLSVAGAYWRGSEKNKMLTRIYGTCFSTQKELDEYLKMLEEAKKRDHRKLGKELDLFTFSDLVGKGLPLFTPKGTMLRELLNDFSQKLRLKKGYQQVFVPHIARTELYKTSGHWDKFGDELFLVKSQETKDEMVLKPMNCPHHQQIFASKPRSYKDLPIKYMETSTVYRDEKAGELIGLTRVRSATQDDSHTFCTQNQIKEVYNMLIEVVKEFYDALKMTYRARISLRDPKTPEKYLGENALWEKAEKIIEEVAEENKLDYLEALGEAAFYGPKIDFMVKDSLGRQWQLATPQLDFVQPKRFGLTYIDEQGKEQTPVMIHFALMGSLERFLSIYIEHTGGAFPLWLSPVQAVVIPIADRHQTHAQAIYNELLTHNIRATIDDRSETMQAKIRDATLQKAPYMVIIGDKEIKDGSVSVRARTGEDLGQMKISIFLQRLQKEIDKKI